MTSGFAKHEKTPTILGKTCPLGITKTEIEQLAANPTHFWQWMRGQTMGLCEGRTYDHTTRTYSPSECGDNPHGPVVYRFDFDKYAARHGIKPCIDTPE